MSDDQTCPNQHKQTDTPPEPERISIMRSPVPPPTQSKTISAEKACEQLYALYQGEKMLVQMKIVRIKQLEEENADLLRQLADLKLEMQSALDEGPRPA